MSQREPQFHVLKSWPQFFRPYIAGTRTHELRHAGHDFAIGDMLELHEWDETTEAYTGSMCVAEVTSVTSDEIPCALSGSGLTPGFIIMSVKVIATSVLRAVTPLG